MSAQATISCGSCGSRRILPGGAWRRPWRCCDCGHQFPEPLNPRSHLLKEH